MEYDFSKLGSLNMKDVGKGCLTAAGSAVILPLLSSAAAGAIVINPIAMGLAALSAGISYLLKQLATGSKGELLKN